MALVTRQGAALSFAIQHAMPPELSGKWRTQVFYREQGSFIFSYTVISGQFEYGATFVLFIFIIR